MANLIQIDTTGCNSDYTVNLPSLTTVGKYITVKDKGTNPSFFASNSIIIVSGQPFFGGSTAEYIRASRGALSFITTTNSWRLLNTVPYTTLGQATLSKISTTELIVYGGVSTFGQLTTNGIRVGSIDAQIAPTVNGVPLMNMGNIASTVVGLGSSGFLSSVSAMNESFTSTTKNLGSYGYVSTPQMQSTMRGLGTSGYISATWLTSTVQGLGQSYLSTMAPITSTVQGLGTFGYISSSWLTSTMQGLGHSNTKYISTPQLTSTVSNLFKIDTSNYLSTFQKIGSNYISSSFLTNTIQNLGFTYVSTGSFNSSIVGTATGYMSNLTSSVTGFGSLGYISTYSLFSTTGGIALINQSNTAASLSSLGGTYIATSAIQSTVAGLASNPFNYISTASLVSTMSGLTGCNTADLVSSVINMGQYYISRGGLVSTNTGLRSNFDSNITSTINNLGQGTNAYISTASLQSTVNGLASEPFNYVSTASITSTNTGMSNAVTATNSTLIGLGSVGYVSAPSLTSTIQALGSLPYRYVSTASLVSTVQGLGTFGYISRENLNVTTNTLASLNHMPPITSTLNGLGNYYISTAVVDVYQVTTVPGISVSDVGAITSAVIQTSAVTTSTVAGSTSGSANGQLGTFAAPRGLVLDSAGNIYVSDYTNCRIRRITPLGNVSTYAGSATSGSADGNGTSATFNQPFQLAIDPFGNIYVADDGSHKIRKIDTFRNVTTIAGSGTASEVDGQGTSASFNTPAGIAIDSSGFLYVSGRGNKIRRITPTGYVTIYAGTGTAGANDGQWNVATFDYPRNLAFGSNVLYVADSLNNKIRSITETRTVSTYAPSPSTSNTGKYQYPAGLAFDSSGNLYLADRTSSVIWKITGDGATITPFAGSSNLYAYVDGPGSNARFNQPSGIAFDSAGNMYVTDHANLRIRKIDTNSNVTTYAGSGVASSTDGQWYNASFNYPYGIAVDSSGVVYVAENSGHRIKKIVNVSSVYSGGLNAGNGIAINSAGDIFIAHSGSNQIFSSSLTFKIGTGVSGYKDGVSSNAQFNYPCGLAFDSLSNLIIADTNNHSIRTIRSPYSNVQTIAGGFGSKDGHILVASFKYPSGVAVDSSGSLYVADTNNFAIRKITQIAGGFLTAATSNTILMGIVVDLSGNIYVSDWYTNCIFKYNSSGILQMTVGNGIGGYADGASNIASFNHPFGLVLDSSSNIYVADQFNHRIRKITPTGTVSLFAGAVGGGYYDTSSVAALFNNPRGIAFDSSGNMYVADTVNSVIRKISGGQVTTYAGTTPGPLSAGFTDGPSATAKFYYPSGITVDSTGIVYVADSTNNAIRKISGGNVTTVAGLGPANSGSTDGPTSNATFANPLSVSLLSDKYILVGHNSNVRGINLNTSNVESLLGVIVSHPITCDSAGYIYVGITNTSGLIIYKFGTVVSTFATGLLYPGGVAVDSSNNVWVADTANSLVKKYNSNGQLQVTYGSTSGTVDGSSNTAKFDTPSGIIASGTNIFISQNINAGSIRMIANDNVTTFVTDLSNPAQLAINSNGVLYVANSGASNIVTRSRTVTTFVGSGTAAYADGNGTSASFNGIYEIAMDTSNNLYVADLGNCRVRKVTPGGTVTTLAGSGASGFVNGPSTTAQLNPLGVYVDSAGLVYASDYLTGTIRLIYPDGYVTSIAGTGVSGFLNGSAGNATFNNPRGIVRDSAGNIYVTDVNNYALRKIALSRAVATFAGTGVAGTTNGAAATATFNNPIGIAVDGASVYVADVDGHDIRKISGGQVSTYAGSSQGSADGTSATFKFPTGLATDPAGNVYVADQGNFRVRKITPYSYANTLFYANTTDVYKLPLTTMTPASIVTGQANINGMTCDRTYVYATCGSMVKSFHMTTGAVTILAGTASPGSSNGTSQASVGFSNLQSIAIDPTFTNLYVCDNGNAKIRKIQISPLSVTTQATLSNCIGIAIDSYGTYAYVTTSNNNLYKVSLLQQEVTTLLASVPGYPQYVSLDPTNTYAYVTCINSNVIRQVNLLTNAVTTIAGSGAASSVDGAGTSASFSQPYGVAFNPYDSYLYSTDRGSGLLRKIATQLFLSSMIGLTQSKTVPMITPNASMTTPQVYRFIYKSGSTVTTTPNLYILNNTINTPVNIAAGSNTVTAKTFTAVKGTAGGSNGYFYGDGTYITVTSDIRTKENIQSIKNALTIVRQLQAVEYTKIDDSRRWLGYIAQDVEQLIPDIVRTDSSPEQWKSIQYTYLPGLIIEALKELKAKIDTLGYPSKETV